MNTQSMIDVENLSVRYGARPVLSSVSLDVPAGAVFALLGRNGTGKSSLVRCLLGHQRPTQGKTFIATEDVWKNRARLMNRVGFVPEDSDAPPEMTVDAVLRFCSRLYQSWDQKGALERLGRGAVPLDVPFGRLSKGQRKQVALALALAPSPDVLILDDPSLGLDVVARKVLFDELISELADRGITIFVTTHDLAGIEGIADRVAILRDGKVALNESMETLKWRFRRLRYVRTSTEAESSLQPLTTLGVRKWGTGYEAIISNFDDLSFEGFRKTSGARDVEVSPMSLEEIFLAVNEQSAGVES